MADNTLIYELEHKPPMGKAIVLAAQHVLTMFGATVAVPLLLGGPDQMNLSQEQIGVLISSVMLCSGLATFIQTTYGSRLPIIQGVSFSFLAAFITIISFSKEHSLDAPTMMRYIAGTIMIGAIFEILVGFSGLMGWLRRILSPVVVGPVIILIGLALFEFGAPKAATCWPISALTIVLVILFSLVLSRNHQVFKLYSIVGSIVIVCAICWICSVTGVFPSGHPAHIGFESFESAAWVRVNPKEVVFPWGAPMFDAGFIVAGLAGYLASMIESFGDYHACSNIAAKKDPTPHQISRGIGCEGVGCLITSVLGGFSSTSYSENIGLIGLTRVGSRFVVQIAAVMLVLLGLFGKFGALAATIPTPVIGGLYCVLFGLIAAVGIQQLARADLSSDRNMFIAGFSLFMGLSVPAYFKGFGSDHPTWEEFSKNWDSGLKSLVYSMGSTGMGVAGTLGVILDNIIPGTHEERGINVPSVLAPEGADITLGSETADEKRWDD
ncbi:MAG TPA: solute carrier family 23 protein [Phycisphaerae bacterium]|nr:solute carrier family 23 protein [Phycisphaerae bacterium]HRW51324.1 solute carrier family 23 protein [Phycisphaerae bacterium]